MKYLWLLLLFPFQIFAQTVSVSPPLDMKGDTNYELIGNLKNRTLVLEVSDLDFVVHCFDERLNWSWEKELTLDGKRTEIIGIVPGKSDFSVFYSFRERGDIIIKTHRYDAAANLVDSTQLKNFGRIFHTPAFSIVASENEEKTAIYYFEDGKEIFTFCYDIPSKKIEWEQVFLLEDGDGVPLKDYDQTVIDNEGNIHFVFDKENRKSRIEEHYFEILEYGPRLGLIPHLYKIDMKGYLTHDVFFEFDNLNERLVAGGLYYIDNANWAEGYYYVNINSQNLENSVVSFRSFDADFLGTLNKKKSHRDKGISQGEIQELVLRRDGGILMIGEISKTEVRGGGGSMAGRLYTTIDYYHEDIFAISIHPDGAEHWKKVMHKKQYSQDDDAMYSSYFLLKTPSALRVIFNDEVKHETTVSEYVLTGTGEADRNAVMNTQNQKLRLRFRDAVQVASDELIVMSENRSKLKLVKVKY